MHCHCRVDRANEITYRDFAKEASLLIEVNDDGGHVNIVSLIGLVVDAVNKKGVIIKTFYFEIMQKAKHDRKIDKSICIFKS